MDATQSLQYHEAPGKLWGWRWFRYMSVRRWFWKALRNGQITELWNHPNSSSIGIFPKYGMQICHTFSHIYNHTLYYFSYTICIIYIYIYSYYLYIFIIFYIKIFTYVFYFCTWHAHVDELRSHGFKLIRNFRWIAWTFLLKSEMGHPSACQDPVLGCGS